MNAKGGTMSAKDATMSAKDATINAKDATGRDICRCSQICRAAPGRSRPSVSAIMPLLPNFPGRAGPIPA